jgi:hypothetical protein
MHILFRLIIFLLVIHPFIHGQSLQDPWISLFNGVNLEGWSVRCLPEDRGKNYWKVVDEVIECNSLGDREHNYVWLVSEKEFSDFHLVLEFQVFRSSGGNSGVQFRSRYDDSDGARYGGWLNGPQVDIHAPLPARTGLIYDETEGVRRWIYPSLPDWNISSEQFPPAALKTRLVFAEDEPDRWNRMEIVCRGMHVETRVNGNLVADFDGAGILDDEPHRLVNVGSVGSLALQLHMNDELKIRYRNIKIREFK